MAGAVLSKHSVRQFYSNILFVPFSCFFVLHSADICKMHCNIFRKIPSNDDASFSICSAPSVLHKSSYLNSVDSDLTGLRFKWLLKCESSTVLTVVLTLIDNSLVIDIHVL